MLKGTSSKAAPESATATPDSRAAFIHFITDDGREFGFPFSQLLHFILEPTRAVPPLYRSACSSRFPRTMSRSRAIACTCSASRSTSKEPCASKPKTPALPIFTTSSRSSRASLSLRLPRPDESGLQCLFHIKPLHFQTLDELLNRFCISPERIKVPVWCDNDKTAFATSHFKVETFPNQR